MCPKYALFSFTRTGFYFLPSFSFQYRITNSFLQDLPNTFHKLLSALGIVIDDTSLKKRMKLVSMPLPAAGYALFCTTSSARINFLCPLQVSLRHDDYETMAV